eukprot:1194381-Prorocentrum_minimum.AAC.2
MWSYNITWFYGSSRANNGKGALNTPETLPSLCGIFGAVGLEGAAGSEVAADIAARFGFDDASAGATTKGSGASCFGDATGECLVGVYAGARTSAALASARAAASAVIRTVVGVVSAASLVADHPGTLVAGSPAATPEFPVYVTDACGFKVRPDACNVRPNAYNVRLCACIVRPNAYNVLFENASS